MRTLPIKYWRRLASRNYGCVIQQDPKLEIAHILTIDVVAYSTLLITEQSRLMANLVQAVRTTARFRHAEAEGKLIRLPTGDGMALVFFNDPEAPVDCAMEITAGLKQHPEIKLRMGIHSGPVNQIADVNDRSNVAGAGIDMAQRVMDCGDAGHILLSQRVADDLAPYPRWNSYLHKLGECEVKHGRKISLVNFFADGIGNPAVPAKMHSATDKKKTPHRKNRGLIFGIIALALVLMGTLFFVRILRPNESDRSIAVLPFVDLSPAKDQAYLSDGITEQIANLLARVPGLFVVARTSTFVFKNQNLDAREVGRRLHVSHLLEGSVSRSGNRSRIDAQLVNASNGYQVWSETYDSDEKDILSLQSDVAGKVVAALRIELQVAQAEQIAKQPTSDPEAYDLYLRGRYLLNKRTAESIEKALHLFKEAVARDPNFALGHTGIADSYILLGEYGVITTKEASGRARPEVSLALGLDDHLAEAYISRAMLLTDLEWNWHDAEIDYRKAIALNPNSAVAHHWYALHLGELGRVEEALREIAMAERRDPLAPIIRAAKAKILCVAGRFPEAIEQSHKALDLEPNFTPALAILANAYSFKGRHVEAIATARHFVELSGADDGAKLELAFAYAQAGKQMEAEAIINEVTARPGAFSPYDMATIRAASHDNDGAFQWLDSAIKQRSVDAVWMRVDPRLANIRADARFAGMLSRMTPRR